jgi:hypothetical protein
LPAPAQPAHQAVLARLGFKLTAAQTKVLREIRGDMGGAHPMRRLLQGDVGSGKTAVAACTALMALESGFNVALHAHKSGGTTLPNFRAGWALGVRWNSKREIGKQGGRVAGCVFRQAARRVSPLT